MDMTGTDFVLCQDLRSGLVGLRVGGRVFGGAPAAGPTGSGVSYGRIMGYLGE